MFNSNGYSLSDIAAVSGNSNDGTFGGNGSWILVLIILIAVLGGWSNGNGFGGNSGFVSDNYALVTDNATLERKIDGVYAGICDSTFALNNTMTNGFASAQNTMTQGFAGLNTALVAQGYESRIATQGVGNQLAQCCCDLRQQISDVNYNLAANTNVLDRTISDKFCQTNFNMQTNTRDIIDNGRSDTQAILAKLDAMENSRKDEKIAEQQAMISDLKFAASQANQNNVLINTLRPLPTPCYTVANPWGCNCGQNVGYFGTTIA